MKTLALVLCAWVLIYLSGCATSPGASAHPTSTVILRHPDGRMGSDPALATPDKGRELVMLAAQSLVRELDAFSRESMPS